MHGAYIKLPTDPVKLGRIIKNHCDREEAKMNWRRLRWMMAFYYLNGVRRFNIVNPFTYELQWSYLDDEGNVEFQAQDLLSMVSKNTGRLEAMDLGPLVLQNGWTLAAIRDRAVAQALADSVVGDQQLLRVQKQFAHLFGVLGTAGICGHILDHPTIGVVADLEVIHPKELFPFPTMGTDYTKQCGLVRQRVVPMDWLAENFGDKVKTDEFKREMDVQSVMPGSSMERDTLVVDSLGVKWHDGNQVVGNQATDEMEIVKLRELWIHGPRETVGRYVVISGTKVIADLDPKGKEVYCPVGVGRFIETGDFHGSGLFDLLYPITREYERFVKGLVNNIRDLDRYGVLVLPQGQIQKKAVLEDIGHGLRTVFWAPDALAEGFSPFHIQPFNTGDLPGKVAQFLKEQTSSINPLRDLVEEKGRVDSALGLQILDEKLNQGMTNATTSIKQAFGTAYREVVRQAAGAVVDSEKGFPISRLSLDLVGVRMDRMTGMASFANNPLPNVGRLQWSVREVNPKSKVARKQEAVSLFQMGVTDAKRLLMFCLEEGLDLAMRSEGEKAAIEVVIGDLIELYGDGVTPGKVKIAPYTVRPDIQMEIVAEFLGGPHMRVASVAVKTKVMQYRDQLMRWSGIMMPSPLPEDLANFQANSVPAPTQGGMSNVPQ